MRLARLANPAMGTTRAPIWDAGCDVVGPLLVGFVSWCLDRARRLGLRRLYFVSRDGQILHRIAREISPRTGDTVECRYLFGSRQAWHLAGVERLEPEHMEWILAPTQGLSVRHVLERVGLAADDFEEALTRAGFGPGARGGQGRPGGTQHGGAAGRADSGSDAFAAPLDADARARLGRILLAEPFAGVVERAAARRRDVALRYLVREGLASPEPAGMVDIGWHGNLQRSLGRLLRLGMPQPPSIAGFYLGLLREPEPEPGHSFHAYWDRPGARGRPLRRENLGFFEAFTAADHGSVMGYEAGADGAVQPVFRTARNQGALDWGLDLLQESVVAFARRWAVSWPATDAALDPTAPPAAHAIAHAAGSSGFAGAESLELQELAQANFRLFYSEPSRGEAEVWGAFPYSDQQVESRYEGFVPCWSRWRVMKALWGRGEGMPYWWQEGTDKVRPCLALRLYIALRRLKWRMQDGLWM
jgi:hypothetical protein